MNTPQKPLAERITQGRVGREQYAGYEDSWRVTAGFYRICGGSNTVSDADSELIAEAFNVTHETGKTPRELANLVEELKDEILALHEQLAGEDL